MVTRALIQEQHKQWDGMPLADVETKWHQSLALRQLDIINRHGLTLTGSTPDGFQIQHTGAWRQLSNPIDGASTWAGAVTRHLVRLLDLDIWGISQLLNPAGTHLIPIDDLQRISSRVKAGHKRALMRVILHMHSSKGPDEQEEAAAWPKHNFNLPAHFRQLPQTVPTLVPPVGRDGLRQVLLTGLRQTNPAANTPRDAPPPQHQPTATERRPNPRKHPRSYRDEHDMERHAVDFSEEVNADSDEARYCHKPTDVTEDWLRKALKQQINRLNATKAGLSRRPRKCRPNATQLINLYYWRIEKIICMDIKVNDRRGKSTFHQVQHEPTLMFKEHLDQLLQLRDSQIQTTRVEHVAMLDAREVVWAHWAPMAETEAVCLTGGHENWDALVEDYQQRQAAAKAGWCRRDGHLTTLERQGCWVNEDASALHHDAEQDKMLRNRIHISTDTCNPDRDLPVAPRRWVINRIGTIAHVYDPAGHWIGATPLATLGYLYGWWTQQHPEDPCFATSMGRLMRRVDSRYSISARVLAGQDPSVTTPAERAFTTWALQHGTGVAARLTNPLCLTDLTCETWHDLEGEQLMGASGHAYTRPWHGANWVAPDGDATACSRALRWAMASAATAPPDTPVMSCVLIPNGLENLYSQKCLPTNLVLMLGRVMHMEGPTKNAVMIANTEALRCYGITAKSITALKQGMQCAGGQDWQADWGTPNPHAPVDWFTPKAFNRLPKEGATLAHLDRPKPRQPRSDLQRATTVTACYNWTPPHKAGGDTAVIYTDGSCRQHESGQCTGAAVIGTYLGLTTKLAVDPKGRGETNTINRAELAAVHQGIVWAGNLEPRPTHLTIYTDSLCTIAGVRRHLCAPQSGRFDVHKALLEATVDAMKALASTGCEIHIKKVKSHIGVRGNEEADRIAKMAAEAIAKGKQAVQDCEWLAEATTAAARQGVIWPAKQGNPGEPSQPLPNLTDAVHSVCADACEQIYGGPVAGVYASLWRKVAPVLRKESDSMWGSRDMSWRQRLVALKCRWGCLWTAKRARMIGKQYMGAAVNVNAEGKARCPLCEGADGATHVLGGCSHPAMQGLYVKRHDDAVKMIHEAICSGGLQKAAVMMDAGKRAELPGDVVNTKEALPTWVTRLSPRHTTATLPYITAPDIVIFHDITHKEVDHMLNSNERMRLGQRVTIIEVGYCSDTDALSKLAEKQEQHRVLVDTLNTLGFRAKSYAIPLGNTGMVYKVVQELSMVYNTTQDLSIACTTDTSALKRMCRRLSKHATRYAHTIVVARRQHEHDRTTKTTNRKRIRERNG